MHLVQNVWWSSIYAVKATDIGNLTTPSHLCVWYAGRNIILVNVKNHHKLIRTHFWGGKHTANYRGCIQFKIYANGEDSHFSKTVPHRKMRPANNNTKNAKNKTHDQLKRSYADTTLSCNITHQSALNTTTDSSHLRLEKLLEKLIAQNAQIIRLLTKLVTKLLYWPTQGICSPAVKRLKL